MDSASASQHQVFQESQRMDASIVQSAGRKLLNWYSNNIESKMDEICACGSISANQVLHDDDLNTEHWNGGSVFLPVNEYHKVQTPESQAALRRGGVEESKDSEEDIKTAEDYFHNGYSKQQAETHLPTFRHFFSSTAIGMVDETMRTIASIHHKDTMPAGNTSIRKIETMLDEGIMQQSGQWSDTSMRDVSCGFRRIRKANPLSSKSSMEESFRARTPASHFSNIGWYSAASAPRENELAPTPHSPADTCTTVSLSQSFDTLVEDGQDHVVGVDVNSKDMQANSVLGSRRPVSSTKANSMPMMPVKQQDPLPMMPDPLEMSEGSQPYLLRMKPQHYIYENRDDCDYLYLPALEEDHRRRALVPVEMKPRINQYSPTLST